MPAVLIPEEFVDFAHRTALNSQVVAVVRWRRARWDHTRFLRLLTQAASVHQETECCPAGALAIVTQMPQSGPPRMSTRLLARGLWGSEWLECGPYRSTAQRIVIPLLKVRSRLRRLRI